MNDIHSRTAIDSKDWRSSLRAPTRRFIAWAANRPDRFLTLSNETGRWLVAVWDRSSDQQFPLPPEAKASYTWISPDGDTVYYVKDTHDNEIGHLMRVPSRGGEPRPATPELPPMYYFGLQIARDGTLYFAGAGQGSYRIYRLDSSGARVLYEHANEAYLPFLSSGETLLAFSTSEHGNNRHWQATVIDACTGTRVLQLDDGEDYSVNPGYWLMGSIDLRPWSPVPGDQRLLFTSNVTGEPKPGIWNVAIGDRTDLANDLPGEVTPVSWTPDAEGVLLQQAYQGRISLHHYNIAKSELHKLPHAEGTLSPLPMFPDGTILYSYSSLRTPPQTREMRNSQESVIVSPSFSPLSQHWEPIHYQSSDGVLIHGFLGIPRGTPPFPAILHVHGGPTGQVTDSYVATWQHLVDEGYLFLTINFRGSTGYGRAFQEQIIGNPGHWELEDMKAARDYLIEQGLTQAGSIALFGGSYGGYLTLMGLTRQPELWAAGFAFIPCCNFKLIYEDANQRLKGWARTLLGGTPDETPDTYWNCSPIAQVERIRAPLAIIAHRSDSRCPLRQVEEFVGRLRELGIDHDVEITEGGHGTRSVEEAIHHHERLLEFLAKYLNSSTSRPFARVVQEVAQ